VSTHRPKPSAASLLLAGLLLGVAPAVSVSQPASDAVREARIGYVDMKRLLDNAPQVVQARLRLEQEFSARDARLGLDEERVAQLRRALQRERAGLATDETLRREDEIDTLERAIERTRQQLREELRRRSEEETERAWATINEAVIAHAREAGLDLVVHSPVIYASARIDLTEAVLARLRAEGAGRPTP
jgi:outer membrane protein